MDRSFNSNSGFTLVEVLVTTAIVVVFLPFAASLLTNSQMLASFSKHRIQAAYVAQQLIETTRQQPLSYFAPQLATLNPTSTPITGQVALDTKGDYSNINCSTNPTLFCGNAVISVTPEVYVNSAGAKIYPQAATYTPASGAPYTYYSIAHVVVQISWNEQIIHISVPMTETYAADVIVDDPMLN